MSIRKAIIVPAILAFGVTGSILAGSVAPVAVAQAPTAHVLASGTSAPGIMYYG
jgi:hypothetical protein